jgi:NADH-quinone oxidoreductase subunit J
MIAALSFYVFAAILLVSAGMVVSVRNPVHSVLFLILAFFNAAALFLLAGAEFLAMILVIVYVGAVAVLFLDINFSQLREGFQRYLPIGATIGMVLLVELAIVLGGWKFAPGSQALRFSPIDPRVENTAALGRILYTDYILMFQASGLVLLVAMIGAIVLTLRDKGPSRRQQIAAQVARTAFDTVEMMDVRSGAGIKELGILRPKVTAPPEAEKLAETHDTHGHGGH